MEGQILRNQVAEAGCRGALPRRPRVTWLRHQTRAAARRRVPGMRRKQETRAPGDGRVVSPEPPCCPSRGACGRGAAAAVACQLNIDSSGSIENIGLGLTNVGSTPIRASSAEELLKGKKPDENMLAEAGRLAAADSEPMEDLRGSAEYKRALVNELTQRAIKLSLQRAEGSR